MVQEGWVCCTGIYPASCNRHCHVTNLFEAHHPINVPLDPFLAFSFSSWTSTHYKLSGLTRSTISPSGWRMYHHRKPEHEMIYITCSEPAKWWMSICMYMQLTANHVLHTWQYEEENSPKHLVIKWPYGKMKFVASDNLNPSWVTWQALFECTILLSPFVIPSVDKHLGPW